MNEIGYFIGGRKIRGESGPAAADLRPGDGNQRKRGCPCVGRRGRRGREGSMTGLGQDLPLKRARIPDRFKMLLWERADRLAEAISAEHGKTHDDALPGECASM